MNSVAADLLSLAAELSGSGRQLVSLAKFANDIGQHDAAASILEAGYLAFDTAAEAAASNACA